MAGSPYAPSDEADDAEPEIRGQAMIATEASRPRSVAASMLNVISNINSAARMLTLDDLREERLRARPDDQRC